MHKNPIILSSCNDVLTPADAPNGISIVGSGSSFPVGMSNGEYFLRTDFEPHRLFKKSGSRMIKISDDNKKAWSAANKILTSFINNDNITTNTDGTTASEKTNLSKAVKPKADN